jgi:ABC-type nickel/cobalt efflux system permease component RcnA
MTTAVSIILLGFFLGVRHATDADHVIAVSTIVTRRSSAGPAILIGALWGIGHTLTIAAVGAAIILFNVVISPRVGLSMELAVGLMLVLLGLSNLSGLTQRVTVALTPAPPDAQPPAAPGAQPPASLGPLTLAALMLAAADAQPPTRSDALTPAPSAAQPPSLHMHPHAHGDYVHSHPHAHAPELHGHREDDTPTARLDRIFGQLGAYQTLRPLAVGLVHGLAGSAAIALMVLATIRDPLLAIGYLLVFGIGTIVGMMLITLAIALPLTAANRRVTQSSHYLALASGALSLAFGLFVVYRIGIVDGLFTTRPHWIPQ